MPTRPQLRLISKTVRALNTTRRVSAGLGVASGFGTIIANAPAGEAISGGTPPPEIGGKRGRVRALLAATAAGSGLTYFLASRARGALVNQTRRRMRQHLRRMPGGWPRG